MDSVSSSARIFSTSRCLIAALIPRRTLRRNSSFARMASTRSFWIFSARLIAVPRLEEYSRREKREGWGTPPGKLGQGRLAGKESSKAKPGSDLHLTASSGVANVVHFYFAG